MYENNFKSFKNYKNVYLFLLVQGPFWPLTRKAFISNCKSYWHWVSGVHYKLLVASHFCATFMLLGLFHLSVSFICFNVTFYLCITSKMCQLAVASPCAGCLYYASNILKDESTNWTVSPTYQYSKSMNFSPISWLNAVFMLLKL